MIALHIFPRTEREDNELILLDPVRRTSLSVEFQATGIIGRWIVRWESARLRFLLSGSLPYPRNTKAGITLRQRLRRSGRDPSLLFLVTNPRLLSRFRQIALTSRTPACVRLTIARLSLCLCQAPAFLRRLAAFLVFERRLHLPWMTGFLLPENHGTPI